MKKELKALIAEAQFVQAIEKLIEIGKPFDEKKAATITKWEQNTEVLSSEKYKEQQTDLYGADGISGLVMDLIKHIDTI